jgi:hypothetical protein
MPPEVRTRGRIHRRKCAFSRVRVETDRLESEGGSGERKQQQQQQQQLPPFQRLRCVAVPCARLPTEGEQKGNRALGGRRQGQRQDQQQQAQQGMLSLLYSLLIVSVCVVVQLVPLLFPCASFLATIAGEARTRSAAGQTHHGGTHGQRWPDRQTEREAHGQTQQQDRRWKQQQRKQGRIRFSVAA